MTALALLEDGPSSDGQLREALSGNLCRCTGYQSIVAGVRDALDRVRSAAAGRP